MSCGISVPFETLSPTRRQVTHVLLTRLPLSCPLRSNRVRLACVRHAASVDSEPGSNSHVRWFASRDRMFSAAIGQLLTQGLFIGSCVVRPMSTLRKGRHQAFRQVG